MRGRAEIVLADSNRRGRIIVTRRARRPRRRCRSGRRDRGGGPRRVGRGREDAADEDRVGAVAVLGLEDAVEARQGLGEDRRAARRLGAGQPLEAVLALDAVPAREPPGDVEVRLGQDVDGKAAGRRITGCALAEPFTQASSVGGASVSEQTAVAVSPVRSPGSPQVMTATAPGTVRMQRRNSAGSTSGVPSNRFGLSSAFTTDGPPCASRRRGDARARDSP